MQAPTARPREAATKEAGRLRLTGSFRIERPQVFLGVLPQVLPVRVVAATAAPGLRIERRR